MQAGFREKNQFCIPRDSDCPTGQVSAHTVLGVLGHLGPGCWAILEGLLWPTIPAQASAPWQRCQREDRRWLLLTKQLKIPTSIAKQRKFILSSPTFSRFFFPTLECPASYHQAPGALRLPPSWPEAFYLPFSSISSRSTLPKVHKNPLPSPCCAGDLK